jgi:hypothetical protein
MPPILRTDRNQEFGPDGKLVSSETVEVDVTAEVNAATLHGAATAALANNRTFLAIQGAPTNAQVVAQVRALTRQNQALIRLVLGLLDETD